MPRRVSPLFLLCGMLIAIGGCGGSSSSSLLGLETAPVITGITPNPVVRGNTITITGTSLNGTSTTAYFTPSGGGAATVAYASSGNTTSVVVSVPTSVNAGTYNVYVVTSDSSGDVSSQSNSVTIALQ